MANFSNVRLVLIAKSVSIALYMSGTLFTTTEACDGYSIKLHKMEPCDNKGTIKVTNPKVELLKDCHILISGCADVTTGFSSCKVTYEVTKTGMIVPFKGEKDGCEELAKLAKQPEVAEKMKEYKINKNCPIQKVKACSTKGEKIDVSSYKDKFRLAAGRYKGTITVQTNNVANCYKFDMEFKHGK